MAKPNYLGKDLQTGGAAFPSRLPAQRGSSSSDGRRLGVGEVRVGVTKNGYFPANASITADAAREFVVRVEMQPQEEVKES